MEIDVIMEELAAHRMVAELPVHQRLRKRHDRMRRDGGRENEWKLLKEPRYRLVHHLSSGSRGNRHRDDTPFLRVSGSHCWTATMVTMIFFFLGLLLTALGLGPAFSHVLEMPGKRRLSPTVWLAVQQTLFTSFGRTLGIVESAAFLATLVLAFL